MSEAPDKILSRVTWRKSSYTANNGNCVEIGEGLADIMPVRDSKNPDGPALIFPMGSWADFVAGVKAGDFPLV